LDACTLPLTSLPTVTTSQFAPMILASHPLDAFTLTSLATMEIFALKIFATLFPAVTSLLWTVCQFPELPD
jgi:hypothetical protein